MTTDKVQQTMESVRREICENKLISDVPEMITVDPLPEYRYKELCFWSRRMAAQKYLAYEREIGQEGILRRTMKRLVRKLCRFLVKPALEDQTEFNSCTVEFSGQVASYIQLQERRVAQLQKEVQVLRGRLAEGESER